MILTEFHRAAGEGQPGVAARQPELEEALGGERDEEGEPGAVHHRSSTSSEQKPGPIASSKPTSPARASPERTSSSRTKSTDAEERFPTPRRESQERPSLPAP